MNVAVFGTLKSNERANGKMLSSTFIGNGITSESFEMSCVGYPYISPVKSGGHPVAVEVYDADDNTLEELDWYEGYPHHYDKKTVQIIMENSSTEDCLIYFVHEIEDGEPVEPDTDGILNWRGV